MKKYQAILIFIPNVAENIIDKTIKAIQKKFNLTRIDRWGVKKMPYPMRQATTRISYYTGNYVCANIEGTDEKLTKLQQELKNDTNIIDFILVRTEGKND